MRPKTLSLVSIALVPLIYWIVARSGLPVPIMAAVGIGLSVAPGYLWSYVLLDESVTGLERVAVVCGLCLIAPVLGGLVLYAADVALNRVAWASLLTGITLVGVVVLMVRQRSNPPSQRKRSIRLVSNWTIAAYGAAVVIAVGALAVARIGVAEQKNPGFTQLWLSPQGRSGDEASLGVSNHQGNTARFRLVVLRRSRPSETWNVTLADDQTWQRTIHLTGPQPVAADLYRLPNLKSPYRSVTTDVKLAKS
jgi:hypothetical protein